MSSRTVSPAKPDLSRSNVARYVQLATLFRRHIESGHWAAGDQIPTVDELAAQHGVARATIRQALGILESDALISRFRAKGTFVNAQKRQHLWLDMTTDWRGLLNAREGAVIEVLEEEDVSVLPLRFHDIGTPTPRYRRLRRRHSRDGQIFLVADVFIDAEFFPLIPREALSSTTAMRLATFFPRNIGHAHQTIVIGTADLEMSALLELSLNAPVCLVDRSAVDDRGCLILLSKGVYRGDLVRLDMRL
ncbi:GntR family transcriptional regulator [Bradyrhizobium sp. 141]|nr:GntR family transcriptional regulator [Bradyrhizobium sp. 141]MCK1716930.1 GntR family transcriptional regulator [Bradyrhizobium sp. 141]